MLSKSHISRIEMGSPEWIQARLGKFTSSEFHFLMGDKPLDNTAMNYIYRKVGEELTGLPARENITTDAIEWGHSNEMDAIRKFGEIQGIDYLVTQKLIVEPGSRFGSTPDALWIHRESQDESGYHVTTLEVKCPPSYDAYIRLFMCDTPFDLKKTNKAYYWQVMHQMEQCGTLTGNLFIYNPLFKSGSYKNIPFRIMEKDKNGNYPLRDELSSLKERKMMAIKEFEKIREKMLNAA